MRIKNPFAAVLALLKPRRTPEVKDTGKMNPKDEELIKRRQKIMHDVFEILDKGIPEINEIGLIIRAGSGDKERTIGISNTACFLCLLDSAKENAIECGIRHSDEVGDRKEDEVFSTSHSDKVH